MRCPVPVSSTRRILCVFPAYSPSFGTFSHSYRLMGGGVRAFMPPQGLLVIAAYLPERWNVRFVDENVRPTRAADFEWADVVLVSGMHIQAGHIRGIQQRAKAAGKLTALGGPSASGAPESYPEFDYLHVGELGDATDRLIALLDASLEPPQRQVRLETRERLSMSDFPVPAYSHLRLQRYMLASVQFSSGCPYRCEFCDIPSLYGRQPRLKTPEQVVWELDAMCRQAPVRIVYFVDDNFIGNRRATRELLQQLVRWQQQHGYPLAFACEATLNLAKQTEILELMRAAGFITVFVGIETPDIEALKRIDKAHNATLPILEAVENLNRYGLEVVSGIILGLDGDTPATADRLIEFTARSRIPMLTVNLLQALPKTPLWDRLQGEDRIVEQVEGRESNVRFLRPYEDVLADWKRCIRTIYAPQFLIDRFLHHVETTYRNRIDRPVRGRLKPANLWLGLVMAFTMTTHIGLFADYRREFWRAVGACLRYRQVESLFNIVIVAHHLICFSRKAVLGQQNASFYSSQIRPAVRANFEGLRLLRQRLR
ncbi:MAG: B12-binding domain-containing radical SAM protein [Rhodospirillales bacterium]|nr:B12-binding domain-containing radical SAM protein [Rhodospirillales bacterium]